MGQAKKVIGNGKFFVRPLSFSQAIKTYQIIIDFSFLGG
jgi:hypothetical protein